MPHFQLKVPLTCQTRRIDVFLTSALGGQVSRQAIKRALGEKAILLNGCPVKPSARVKEGDCVKGTVEDDRASALKSEKRDLAIVYEDEDVFVIDKPAGMVVHPGAGNKTGTLVHALLDKGTPLSTLGGRSRPGIVHRLDKETSGLLVVARNNRAHRALQSQFGDRSLSRAYVALVKGNVAYEEGHVDAPIGRHPKARLKMAVLHGKPAKEARTRYRVLKRYNGATLLELKLLTGRTHQIRVHMAYLGHPVVGDALYGNRDSWHRHALHASKIKFIHPKSGKIMSFESALPADFSEIISHYKNN